MVCEYFKILLCGVIDCKPWKCDKIISLNYNSIPSDYEINKLNGDEIVHENTSTVLVCQPTASVS
jgi:hypothetical protein